MDATLEAPSKPDRSSRILFTATILVSSFLLFLIQPMYARMMLPKVGGAPIVWNAALVFFQGVLLVGYYYAHVFSKRLGPVKHASWHWIALLLPLPVLPLMLRQLPGVEATSNPVLWILGTLALGVGLPYVVVATTSPLVQRWFATTNDPTAQDPYFLYAASNIGSFAALIAYPFWMEPRVSLTDQGRIWAGLYILMAVLVFTCSRRVGTRHEDLDDTPSQSIPIREVLIWGFLAFVPSSLMMATTTHITTSVASAPMLWVVPLGLYLLTFVLAFAKRQWMPEWLLTLVAGSLIVVALVANLSGLVGNGTARFFITVGSFFVIAWMIHRRLASRRPSHQHLTNFYFVMSVGGVLGGLFAGLLAPVIFEQVLEYPITLALGALAVFPLFKKRSPWDFLWFLVIIGVYFALHRYSQSRLDLEYFQRGKILWIPLSIITMIGIFRPERFFGGVAVLAFVGVLYDQANNRSILESRSYFGTLRVYENHTMNFRALVHGTTLHGVQSLDPDLMNSPTSYYAEEGPIGDIVHNVPRPPDAHIGIVGCGVGTMTAYGLPGQHWTIFELNPDVVTIDTEKTSEGEPLFTYVTRSKADVKFAVGDARIKLSEAPDKFDLIVLDAYSSDNIPLHLMTVEAFKMYVDKLAPHGIIAVHISNRFLDLQQEVALISNELALAHLRKYTVFPREDPKLRFSSEWVAVARTESDLEPVKKTGDWKPIVLTPGIRVWTDERSSMLDVLYPDWFKRLQ